MPSPSPTQSNPVLKLAALPERPKPPVPGKSAWQDPASERFLRRPLALTILLAFGGALLLQWWRPCFFLTGDTLSAWLPTATEAYRRLWEGRWPFYDSYLFGGYNLLQDLGVFSFLGPWELLSSFLARTRYYFLLPDVVGTGSLVTAAATFCWSALRLRRQFSLPIPPALIVALSLSYAFTPYNFVIGASWIGFLSVPAALPLILAGACEHDWRKALAMQAAAVTYALYGGHMHPFLMMGLFCSLLIVLLSLAQRRWQPLAVWAAAGLLPLLLSLPLLWPAMASFQHTSRASVGIAADVASRFNVPAGSLAASFFLGPASNVFLKGISFDLADQLYSLSIAFALVNLPLLGLLCVKRRWTAVEGSLLAGLLVSALFIVRPVWLANVFASLPLLHSLRWPFREIILLNFFAHALFLMAYQPPARNGARRVVLGAATLGTAIYALVFLCVAPALWLFEPDRQAIMSGEADRYWNMLKASDGPGVDGTRFEVEAGWKVLLPRRERVPFALIGGFNYAALFRVNNVSGFSVTPPLGADWLEKDTGVAPYFWGGVFAPVQARRITQVHPDIQRIALTGILPVATWQIFDGRSVRAFSYDAKTGRVQAQSARAAVPAP